MTTILDAYVRDFGPNYTNPPDLCILVDAIPSDDDFVWHRRGDIGAFWAEKDGFIRVLFHDGSDRNLGGFYGQPFTLRMDDGTTRTIWGPWSGDGHLFWRLPDRPIEPVRVVLFEKTDETHWWERTIGMVSYVTKEVASYVLRRFCPGGYHLAWDDDYGFIPKKVT